jgi:hypothetical protein
MNYQMTEPCDECPFTADAGFTFQRLTEFASGEFPCHKACKVQRGNFVARSDKTPHCAGALIFNEKRGQPHQMQRICGRLGLYDPRCLNMDAPVVSSPDECRPEREG